MSSSSSSMAQNLLKWMRTFETKGSHSRLSDLTDGVALAHVCNEICPEHFNSEWLSKIKESVSPENWRLRVSNIKKVVDAVVDFYENILRMSITASNVRMPDATLIGKDCDEKELSRLMQLILVAAVNCERKEEYIANILTMGTDTQMILKNAIEELFLNFGADGGRNRSSTMESISSITFPDLNLPEGTNNIIQSLKNEIKRLNDELSAATEMKEKTIQEMFDVKRALRSVHEENVQLNVENENLSGMVERLQSSPSKSAQTSNSDHHSKETAAEARDASLKDSFANKLQARIDSLKEELFKTENSREEVRIKNELLEKELMDLKFRNEELLRKANEARSLKDELDIHKQASEKAEKYEQMIEVYKKKLEEAAEFKRKIRSIEEKGISQSSLQISLEEEHRKNSNLKSQNENLKKQIQELHSSAATVAHRAEQSEFELRMIKEKYESILQEKEALQSEISEIRKQTKQSSRRPTSDLLSDGTVVEMLPANSNLGYEISNEEKDFRISELEAEIQLLKSKIILQSQDHSAKNHGTVNPFHEHRSTSSGEVDIRKVVESLQAELYDYQQKVSEMEGVIAKKEEEGAEMEARYRKCVSKAKQVAKVLEPISLSTSGNSSMNSSSFPNIEQLVIDLQVKDKQILDLETEAEKAKQFKEEEERLMSSAFYSLSHKMMRSSMEERLTGRSAGATTSGTFLSRQRQSTGKRLHMPSISHS